MREVSIERFSTNDLDDAQPGDFVMLRCMVAQVSVVTLDVTSYGGVHQILPGERTITLVIGEAKLDA